LFYLSSPRLPPSSSAVLLLEPVVRAACARRGNLLDNGNRRRKPGAGFEIDQAMAALPAHASLPDGRRPVRDARPLILLVRGESLQRWFCDVKRLRIRRRAFQRGKMASEMSASTNKSIARRAMIRMTERYCAGVSIEVGARNCE